MLKILLTFLLSISLSFPVWASDFKIHSQNFLHLGWGATTANKCDALTNILINNDVVIIQELMQEANPCAANTTGFTWESYGPYGNSYKEYYGFLWRNTLTPGKAKIEDGGQYYEAANSSQFIRPPVATSLKITPSGSSSSYFIWIGNIHSIFGKKVSDRTAEAQAVEVFFNALKTMKIGTKSPPPGQTWPIIIGGDWNIPVTNKAGTTTSGFIWLDKDETKASGNPTNTATTLSDKGTPASPYDHFIFSNADTGSTVTLTNVGVYPVSESDQKHWRQYVSDHMGIHAEVTVQ
jgi:type II secretory pathway pseudopilin PulG